MKQSLIAKITAPGYGFVYVMSYPGSDKVKIGHSHDPTNRAIDIGGTLGPEEPVLEAYCWCSERRQDVERRAHLIRAQERYNGEWFKLNVKEAMHAIEQAAKAVSVEIQLAFSKESEEMVKIDSIGSAKNPSISVTQAVLEAERKIKEFIERKHRTNLEGLRDFKKN